MAEMAHPDFSLCCLDGAAVEVFHGANRTSIRALLRLTNTGLLARASTGTHCQIQLVAELCIHKLLAGGYLGSGIASTTSLAIAFCPLSFEFAKFSKRDA